MLRQTRNRAEPDFATAPAIFQKNSYWPNFPVYNPNFQILVKKAKIRNLTISRYFDNLPDFQYFAQTTPIFAPLEIHK